MADNEQYCPEMKTTTQAREGANAVQEFTNSLTASAPKQNRNNSDTKPAEHYKRTEYSSGGYIEEPTIGKQNKQERDKNLRAAKEMAKYYGEQIRLLPISTTAIGVPNPDAINLKTGNNMEIKVPAPLSTSGKNSVQKAIKVANGQNVKELLIYFECDVTRKSVYEGLKAGLMKGRGKKIERIIIRFADGTRKEYKAEKLREIFEK